MMVARVATGSSDRAAWLRRVFGAARELAPTFFAFAEEPAEARPALWNAIALSVATYCDWQSGQGRDEYNFNPGWVAPVSDAVPFFQLADGRKVAAFASLREGMTRLFQGALTRPRVRETMGAGFLSWARWANPGTMDPPPDSRASFDSYIRQAQEVAPLLLQAPLSASDLEGEWDAWSGRYVGPDDTGNVSPEEEPPAAPPRVVRPGFAYSATLGREVPNGACVQSARDRLYYQARAGEWALCPGGVCPATCVERYPLREGSGGSGGSSGSSVGPFLLLGAGWALWWVMGRK
jgi:hypothetical protein